MSVFAIPAILMGCLGLIVGLILLLASKRFATKENPLVDTIAEILPGGNCGVCGFAGCRRLAEGLAANPELEAVCPVGGDPVLEKLAETLGIERRAADRKVARLLCHGEVGIARRAGEYVGIRNCAAAEAMHVGALICPHGCLGLGDCARICPVDAIAVSGNGLVDIDEDKCVGCGACVRSCPRDCIEMVPAGKSVWVACRSTHRAVEVRNYCTVGCIGCGRCQRVCPEEAIELVGSDDDAQETVSPDAEESPPSRPAGADDPSSRCARIIYEKCTACLKCVAECPTHSIVTKTCVTSGDREQATGVAAR